MPVKEIKIVSALRKDVFENDVNEKLKEGFIFFPESFKVAVTRNGEFGEFAIVMFRNSEAVKMVGM